MSVNNVITPKRREDIFDKKGELTLRFVRWVELVTQQTNTSAIDIEANSVSDSYSWPVESEHNDIKRTITTSANYTALVGDFINAKGAVTITFPQYPTANSVIIVRNGDGSDIALDGNGKNMNGESTGLLVREGTAIEFYYFADSDEWFAR